MLLFEMGRNAKNALHFYNMMNTLKILHIYMAPRYAQK